MYSSTSTLANSNKSNNHKREGRKLISRKGRQSQSEQRQQQERCLDPILQAVAPISLTPAPAASTRTRACARVRLRYSTLLIQLLTLNLLPLPFLSLKSIIPETAALGATKDYEDHIQRFSLHSREDCTDRGEFYTSNIKNLISVSELAQTGAMKCFCVWHGMWIFTTMRNYERGFMVENSGMNQMSNPGKICESRKINWHYIQLSSIRHVGNVNDSLPGLSLYRDTDFYGKELYLAAPSGPSGSVSLALPVSKHIKSYGLTGRKRWTIFSNTNFTGNSTCLTPVALGSLTAGGGDNADIKTEPKVSFEVGSIQSGCIGSVVSSTASTSTSIGNRRRKFYDQDNLIALYKAEPAVSRMAAANGNNSSPTPPTNSGQGSNGPSSREAKLVFDGDELRLTSSIRFRHYSVIGAESWTIYSGTEYNGKCECLFPMGQLDQIERMRQFSGLRLKPDPSASVSTTAIYYETMPLPMKNNGTRLVGSIRRGCFVCKMPYTDPALPFSDEYTDYSPEDVDLEDYELDETVNEILQVADEHLLQNGSLPYGNGQLNGTLYTGFNSSSNENFSSRERNGDSSSGENLEEIRSEPSAAALILGNSKDTGAFLVLESVIIILVTLGS